MTPTEIDALEAGPDLDRLVAKACGSEYETNPNPSGLHDWEVVGGNVYGNAYRCQHCHCDCDDGAYGCGPEPPKDGCKPSPILFRPSTDWNDAMLAAEKVGLFAPVGDESFGFIDRVTDGGPHQYRFCRHRSDDNGLYMRVISRHKSGPVAICRAILKASKP